MKTCFYVFIVLLSLLQKVEAFNASSFIGFFFLAVFVVGGLIFLVLCCKDRKYIFGGQRQEHTTAMTVNIPSMQHSVRASREHYPGFVSTTFPGRTAPLQVHIETSYLSYIGEPPPPYPGNDRGYATDNSFPITRNDNGIDNYGIGIGIDASGINITYNHSEDNVSSTENYANDTEYDGSDINSLGIGLHNDGNDVENDCTQNGNSIGNNHGNSQTENEGDGTGNDTNESRISCNDFDSDVSNCNVIDTGSGEIGTQSAINDGEGNKNNGSVMDNSANGIRNDTSDINIPCTSVDNNATDSGFVVVH